MNPQRYSFGVAAAALVLLVTQAGAPSPLYAVYQSQWGLTPILMSVVFAVYVGGLLVSLTTMGSLSDYIGRKPVVFAALALALLALVLLATATDVTQLIVARILQGFGVGLGTGALGAMLIDTAPASKPRLAATVNGIAPPFALGIGALGSSELVQYVIAPTVTVYLVLTALLVIVGALVFFSRETAAVTAATKRNAFASLKPGIAIPSSVAPIFYSVLGCLMASWAMGGLYLGLGSSIVRSLLGLDNAVAAGLAIAAVTVTGGVVGLIIRQRDALRSMIVGAIALVVGPVLTIVALQSASVWGFYASSVVVGIGFGAAFQGGLRLILVAAPAEGRSGLLSSVYVYSYLAFGVPALVAGILVPTFGLLDVVMGYAVFAALLSAVALALQLRRGPSRTVEVSADTREVSVGV